MKADGGGPCIEPSNGASSTESGLPADLQSEYDVIRTVGAYWQPDCKTILDFARNCVLKMFNVRIWCGAQWQWLRS
jgi:hypothetical protein